MATHVPAAALHVQRSDGTAQFLAEEASATRSQRTMMNLRSLGGARIAFLNSTGAPSWSFGTEDRASTKDFLLQAGGVTVFRLRATGDLAILGTLTQLSDRNAKTDVLPLDTPSFLARASALPLSSWRYRAAEGRHVGPMAQDFAAAFGLGADDRHLAPSDVAGVTLAAAQALEQRSRQLGDEVARLERQLAERDREVEALDAELHAAEALLDVR